jgi:hypothetical protein
MTVEVYQCTGANVAERALGNECNSSQRGGLADFPAEAAKNWFETN